MISILVLNMYHMYCFALDNAYPGQLGVSVNNPNPERGKNRDVNNDVLIH